jgi:nucleotide-binding universal stress UspA family protein
MFESVGLKRRAKKNKDIETEHAKICKRILVPVTGRKADYGAIALACELAGQTGKGIIIAVHVIPVERSLPLDAEIEAEIVRAEGLLLEVEEKVKKMGCEVETELLQAREVGPAIIGVARERSVDLILLSLTYKTQFGEFCLGEVAPYIFKNAHCRVLMEHLLDKEQD